jgi:predicted Rdx family selenoprotein
MKTKTCQQILVTVKMSQQTLLLFYNYIKQTGVTPVTGALLQVFRQDIPIVFFNKNV